MVLGVANRVWTISEIVALLEAEEMAAIGTEKNKRGTYKPRKPKIL